MKSDKNIRKGTTAILFTAIIVAIALLVIPSVQAVPDDYYMYGDWNLGAPGNDYLTGINGYIDTNGLIEGIPGAEYVIFTGGPSYGGPHYAYIYRVETAGDPNMHPDNPNATGPVAHRNFTLVSTYYMGDYASGHDNAFYVDDTGIYYGASNHGRDGFPGWGTLKGCGIVRWNFDWTGETCIVPTPAYFPGHHTHTLARNSNTGDWWVGTGDRQLYRWNGSAWVYQFTYPDLAGSHHDGMEIIGDSLFISDMTSDVIIQYRLDAAGNVIDPPNTPYDTFYYTTPAYRNVEGMGYGPNKHIWISGWNSYTIYEIGGGRLQPIIEGIPDQCIFTGDVFDTFDLDDYTVGIPPFNWTYSGNVDLSVSIDTENVVIVTYPGGWTGSETITFTVTDSENNTADDNATFEVHPVPVVGDIPNQTTPFMQFDLDDYLSEIDPALVTWSASEPGDGWTVEIDTDNVVTVTAPEGAIEPKTITFTATTFACGRSASDSDDATFFPNQPPVADANGPYIGYEASPITFNGSGSYDPNDYIVSWLWDLDGDGIYEKNATTTQGIANYTWDDDYSGNVSLKVTDSFGATDVDNTTVTVLNVAPIVNAGPDQEVFAGDIVYFNGSFTDPGNDTHTIEWDFGYGAHSGGTLTPTHIYYDKGVYNVTLTVTDDDGGVGVDTVVVTVKPIPANVTIKPETLNLASKGKFTAFIRLPEPYNITDINISTVVCEGAPAVKGMVADDNKYIAKFRREDLRPDLPTGDAVKMTVTGKVFYNGGYADFEGSDTIRVIRKGK